MFNRFFLMGKYNNYNAAFLGEYYSRNYYHKHQQWNFAQTIATYYSFAGDVNKSDSVFQKATNANGNFNYELKGQVSNLITEISNHQIVIFNEAHHVPKHRYLVGMLLDTLYQNGFRYLALEAFYDFDSLFSNLGFPTTSNGFYLREPTFANLVRLAHSKGYKIIGYDAQGADREKVQAENIYNQTIKIDENAKILILAGYAHISRDWMAGELEKISGIRPFTVNQTYTYFGSLGNTNQPKNSLCLISDTTNSKEMFDANILIYNNLDIKNNCFTSTNAITTNIHIPDSLSEDCAIVCIYNKYELDYFNKNDSDWKPIPVAVCRPQNNAEITINLCNGLYEVLFFDEYGQVLLTKELKITGSL
jgi:hypothetical protein